MLIVCYLLIILYNTRPQDFYAMFSNNTNMCFRGNSPSCCISLNLPLPYAFSNMPLMDGSCLSSSSALFSESCVSLSSIGLCSRGEKVVPG
ncbi:hypothetical protein BJV77DRAFT_385350 [Russula vinacea]|nr:hypothetical protein BJV77DRAFT_385350 [Russula vinacea]